MPGGCVFPLHCLHAGQLKQRRARAVNVVIEGEQNVVGRGKVGDACVGPQLSINQDNDPVAQCLDLGKDVG